MWKKKSEQLKAISNLAALFAGFAVVTLTQFQFDQTQVGLMWIIFYGVLTAITVGLMTTAMVTCTLILGSILKNGKSYVNEEAEEDFMFKCKGFVDTYRLGDRPPFPRRTFEAFWEIRCEDDWSRAFQFFAWGVLSFLVSLIPIGWIKFSQSHLTAILFIAIVGVSILLWGFVQYIWGAYLTTRLGSPHSSLAEDELRVQPAGLPFDWHIAPGNQLSQQ